MELNKSFNIEAGIYLTKSTKTQDDKVIYKVGGIMSTTHRDSDNEIIKSLDLSFFNKSGFGKIKYEHNDSGEPNAGTIIGYPINAKTVNGITKFEGELIGFNPNAKDEDLTVPQRMAKSTVQTLIDIEEFNKRHPEHPQKAGWSIEGEYLEKDKNGFAKARVVNVVFTTKPRNAYTSAELIKSMQTTGYTHAVTDQEGLAAIRTSSINNNKNKNKGEMMFKNKSEVYKNKKAEGLSDEEAMKAAAKWEEDENSKISNSHEKAESAAAEAQEQLKKSTELLNFDSKDFDFNLAEENEVAEIRLKKSLDLRRVASSDEDYDKSYQEAENAAQKFVTVAAKGAEITNAKLDKIAKSISLQNEALSNVTAINTALLEENAFLRSKVDELHKSHDTLILSMRKSGGVLTSNIVNNIKFQETSESKERSGALTKSKTAEILSDLYEAGEVSLNDVIAYESNNILTDLTKSKILKKMG